MSYLTSAIRKKACETIHSRLIFSKQRMMLFDHSNNLRFYVFGCYLWSNNKRRMLNSCYCSSNVFLHTWSECCAGCLCWQRGKTMARTHTHKLLNRIKNSSVYSCLSLTGLKALTSCLVCNSHTYIRYPKEIMKMVRHFSMLQRWLQK